MQADPPISFDFFDAYGQPIPGLLWTHAEADLSYVKPDQKFTVVMPARQSIALPDRVRACLKVFGVPYIYGFSFDRKEALNKSNGSRVTYSFGNLCHLLNMHTLDPRLVFTSQMTVGAMLDAALAKFRQYNPFVQFSIASTNLDVAISVKKGGKKRVKRTLQQLAADDLQVRGGEKIAHWLSTILARSGLHLKEFCDASGLPVIDIDVAQNITTDYSAPDYLLCDSGKSWLQSFGDAQRPQEITILDREEIINDAEMPFCIVGLGHTYGALTVKNVSMRVVIPNEFCDPLLTATEAADWKIVTTATRTVSQTSVAAATAGAIGAATGYALGLALQPPGVNLITASVGASVGSGIGTAIGSALTPGYLQQNATIDEQISYTITTYPTQGTPDPYLIQWSDKFNGLQAYHPETIVSSDSPNESSLIQKMTMLMRSKQFNAYTLEYQIHQPTGSTTPILPDKYVQVTDKNGRDVVYWVSDCKLQISKQKGLLQHVSLKIPNTFYLPDVAPVAIQNSVAAIPPPVPTVSPISLGIPSADDIANTFTTDYAPTSDGPTNPFSADLANPFAVSGSLQDRISAALQKQGAQ